MSHWANPGDIVLQGDEPPNYFNSGESAAGISGYFESMMLSDTLNYLPDDILVKVDRAAMGVSLETRVPLLDHRVVEFAWRLPLHMKVRNGQGKWVLRQVLDKYVPRELIERPKMGFGVPIDSWLRGPLRDWAESLLDESRLRSEGFFNPGPIRKKWAEHLSGQRNWQYHLWDVLMFQAWLEEQKR
jgi:asparagine synthase (glutamine-hydrolysing)